MTVAPTEGEVFPVAGPVVGWVAAGALPHATSSAPRATARNATDTLRNPDNYLYLRSFHVFCVSSRRSGEAKGAPCRPIDGARRAPRPLGSVEDTGAGLRPSVPTCGP